MHPGEILAQNCIQPWDIALDDLFFISKMCFIKSSVNLLYIKGLLKSEARFYSFL